MCLSFLKQDHPAYIKLIHATSEAIPWALERLKATIGHDRGEAMDHENNPWLLLRVIDLLAKGSAIADFPYEDAGKLDKLRAYCLKWGESQGFIKLD